MQYSFNLDNFISDLSDVHRISDLDSLMSIPEDSFQDNCILTLSHLSIKWLRSSDS